MHKYAPFFFCCALLFLLTGISQSAQAGDSTTIAGYGNAVYLHNTNLKTSTANLERFVLFVGHSFGNGISLFSELEVEDAKVSGGEPGGEFALEQAYLKFDLGGNHSLVAGLFTPRIGILNENHLPNSFNGNERTQVETFILPSTWRELGVGVYGATGSLPLNYSFALVNGLNSGAFEHGSVIREGRYEGRNASANNLAVTGALQLAEDPVIAQISAYYGGTVGLASREADSLQLSSGVFGTPVIVGEADVQFSQRGFSARLLGTIISIPQAWEINRAYSNNTPKTAYGAYAEASYNLLESSGEAQSHQLILFARYEVLDMNASIPSNGILDESLRQQHLITGLTYFPIRNVVIKADARFVATGDENPLLPINPDPSAQPYDAKNTILALGIGFSF